MSERVLSGELCMMEELNTYGDKLERFPVDFA